MDISLLTQEAFAHHARGDLYATLTSCQKILELDPSAIAALELCGITQAQLGKRDAAQVTLNNAHRLAPNNLSLLNNLAKLSFDSGNWRQCLSFLQKIQRLQPTSAQLHNRIAQVKDRMMEAAQACLMQLRQTRPITNQLEQIIQTGNDFFSGRRFDDAFECYAIAADLKPDETVAYANLGAAAQNLGEMTLALTYYDKALSLTPNHLPTLLNKGIALTRVNENQLAISYYEKALAIDPQHVDAHWNLSLSLLKIGNYENGWRHYEWRWQRGASIGVPQVSNQPLWLGQTSLKDQHILLYAEQGLGDTLQFFRYVREVVALGARVTLQVSPELVELLESNDGSYQVIMSDTLPPEHDYRCPLMSLPLALETRLNNIPAEKRYVHANPKLVDLWHNRLGEGRRPRVGLVWRGTALHPDDAERSLPLRTMWRFLSPHCRYISLQKEIAASDLSDLSRWPGILDTRSDLHSLADTAALIENLDLVISVDTSVAHLSAAMGKPTWLLLANCPDWRWLLERQDTPWYPTVRLFRQVTRGDWTHPLASIRKALDSLSAPTT